MDGSYFDEIDRANSIIGIDSTRLSAIVSRRMVEDCEVPDVRVILLHIVTETACHADISTWCENYSMGRRRIVCGHGPVDFGVSDWSAER
jgi:hypothetical protein